MAENTNNKDQMMKDKAQQTAPPATPSPTTTPNQTTTVGQTQDQAHKEMSDAEALKQVSPTVTMGQVAVDKTGSQVQTSTDANAQQAAANEAESRRLGLQRAEWARKEANKPWYESFWWGKFAPDNKFTSDKCNELVYGAHVNSDDTGKGYPTLLRNSESNNPFKRAYYRDYYMPTVSELADPKFCPDRFEYHTNINDIREGDIVIWYGNGHHHSAIATGDGKVGYAGLWRAKEEDIDWVNKQYQGTTPIIRRYKVTN